MDTHIAAPNALFFVSARMAANVFVMTAMNRLISQKFRITMQVMKKRHDTKNSASIMLYMIGDHYATRVRESRLNHVAGLTPFAETTMNTCSAE